MFSILFRYCNLQSLNIIGVLHPDDDLAIEGEVNITPIDKVEFEDGATYLGARDIIPASEVCLVSCCAGQHAVSVHVRHFLEPWYCNVMQVNAYIRAMVTSFENKAAEHAVVEMRKHHPDVQRVCKKDFRSQDGTVQVSNAGSP